MSEPVKQESTKSKPGAVVIGFLVLLVGEIIILSNSGLGLPAIQPEPISTYAENVDMLTHVILGITGFFLVLTLGLLVYFLVRYRARPDQPGKAVHTHGHHTLELVWTFIPGLILFSLAVFQTGTWGSIKYRGNMPDPKKDPSVVEVQVFAKQFEWHFRYKGDDPTFGTSGNVVKREELHVPVNRDVLVYLRTQDVLHSFWLPNVRLKQDLVPGKIIPQWFRATKTGRYEIACAELCGVGHTDMRGVLIVETEEEYQKWIASQRTGDHDAASDAVWKYWVDKRPSFEEARKQ